MYKTPKLIRYGTLTELTAAGATGFRPDNAFPGGPLAGFLLSDPDVGAPIGPLP